MKSGIRYLILMVFFVISPLVESQINSYRMPLKHKVHAVKPIVGQGQKLVGTRKGISTQAIVENGDTFPFYKLGTVFVYPPLEFRNKKQEKFYWRTVRDVKRALPMAKYIKQVIHETNDTLLTMKSEKERKKFMRGYERELYKREFDRMNQLTLNQGKLLIRLVSREMDASGYELIKAYRGSFRAGFYQIFARLFGANLKWEYGSREEDEIIERVITLVESGQL